MTKAVLSSALALLALAGAATAQENAYTSETDDYSVELPTPTWKAVPRADAARPHLEFINGDRADGYLRIRKEVIQESANLVEFARAEADTKLRFLPGFVPGGKETHFSARLEGITTAYEYTSGGKPMAGRIYYLRADPRTVYALHFQGARDKLQRIQNQTDSIARSFRVK